MKRRIINATSIQDILVYSSSRLKLKLEGWDGEEDTPIHFNRGIHV
ncbi:MAG: hypothetical protein ABFS10_06305 [Bacteroidota bacterium]